MDIGNFCSICLTGKIEPADICQGQLGDCWLLSALACLAAHEGAVQEVFITDEYSHYGEDLHCGQLLWTGVWGWLLAGQASSWQPPTGQLAGAFHMVMDENTSLNLIAPDSASRHMGLHV